MSLSGNWETSTRLDRPRSVELYAASEIRPEEIDPICHVSRLSPDQQIAYERWGRKWQHRFEAETDRLTYPGMTRKTQEVFAQIEAEMGKSGERIAASAASSAASVSVQGQE